MEQFTKQHAAQCFGFDYKIINHGFTHTILSVHNDHFFVEKGNMTDTIRFDEIGISARILTRPFSDLTKEIEFKAFDNNNNQYVYSKKVSLIDYLNIAKSNVITYHKRLNAIRIPTPNGKGYDQFNFNVNGDLRLPYDIFSLMQLNNFPVGIPAHFCKNLNDI